MNGGLAPWLVAVAAGASGCTRPSPVGGLLVSLRVDGTLDAVDLTALDIEVRAPSDGGESVGGKKSFAHTYAIGPDPSETQLPAEMVVENDHGPGASVVIDVSVWRGAVPIDAREYRIEKIPTDYFAPIDILFSAQCTALVRVEGHTAVSTCPSGETCDPGAARCASNLRVVGADAGAGPPSVEAGDEPGAPPGSMDATLGGDATDGPEVVPDSGASCPDGDPRCAPPDSSACRAPCMQEGTYCFKGQCVPVPPSCIGLDESQCASDEVPGGSFLRSYDGVGYTDANAPATISGLRIDRYEVTVARFENFVTTVEVGTGLPDAGAGKHTHLNGGRGLRASSDAGPSYETGWDPAWNTGIATTQSGWDSNLAGFASSTWYPPRVAVNATLPINSVTWYEAYAFCIWDGGFLPTEAEWNYAATGGGDQRVYPWGSTDPGTTSQYAIYGCYYGGGSGPGSCSGWDNIAPFGSAPKGDGKFGQSDLGGSMWEWTLDSYAPYDPSCTDCVALEGTDRVFRGGAFNQSAAYLTAGSRQHGDPATRFVGVGFRCARGP